MNYVFMRRDLIRDPDLLRIADRLGVDEFSVIGRLEIVWGWAIDESIEGVILGATGGMIDRLVRTPGFADAMVEVGWLQLDDGGVTFPKFQIHLSEQAQARIGDAIRKRVRRNVLRQQKENESARPPARPLCTESDTEIPAKGISQCKYVDGDAAAGGSPLAATASDQLPETDSANRVAEHFQKRHQIAQGAAGAIRKYREGEHTSGMIESPQNRSGAKRLPSVFYKVRDHHLRDPAAVREWFRQHFEMEKCRQLKHLRNCREDLNRVLSAARYAVAEGRDPVGLFAAIVGRGDWRPALKRYAGAA